MHTYKVCTLYSISPFHLQSALLRCKCRKPIYSTKHNDRNRSHLLQRTSSLYLALYLYAQFSMKCVFSKALPRKVERWRRSMIYIHLLRLTIRYEQRDQTGKGVLRWDVQCWLNQSWCPAEWRLQLLCAWCGWRSASRGHVVCSWKEEGCQWFAQHSDGHEGSPDCVSLQRETRFTPLCLRGRLTG